MTYYNKRKNDMKSPVNRVFLGTALFVLLIMGFIARQPIQDMFFEHKEDVDISGEWLGIITEDYDAETRYEYNLTFAQSEDGTVTGTMSLQSTNRPDEIFADSVVAGSISNDDLTFSETRVTYLEGVPAERWCMINVELDYEVINGQETMTGSWTGIPTPGVGSCAGIDGRVILTREQ